MDAVLDQTGLETLVNNIKTHKTSLKFNNKTISDVSITIDIENNKLTLTSTDGFITTIPLFDITNNYYTKTEVDDLNNAQVLVVDELPETGDSKTIYFVKIKSETEEDVYDKYIYYNDTFIKIGSSKIDFSDFYNKSEIESKFKTIETSATITDEFNDNTEVYTTNVNGYGDNSEKWFRAKITKFWNYLNNKISKIYATTSATTSNLSATSATLNTKIDNIDKIEIISGRRAQDGTNNIEVDYKKLQNAIINNKIPYLNVSERTRKQIYEYKGNATSQSDIFIFTNIEEGTERELFINTYLKTTSENIYNYLKKKSFSYTGKDLYILSGDNLYLDLYGDAVFKIKKPAYFGFSAKDNNDKNLLVTSINETSGYSGNKYYTYDTDKEINYGTGINHSYYYQVYEFIIFNKYKTKMWNYTLSGIKGSVVSGTSGYGRLTYSLNGTYYELG